MELEVTTLEDLKTMAKGDIISLPRFKKEVPFNVKVRRVSLLNLVKEGVIPNKLLSAAEELFYGKQSSKGVDMQQLTKVMFIMAENALIEPSIKDLENVDLELTDEQIIALFNYTQEGVAELESFRKESKDNVDNSDKSAESSKTK